MTPREGLVFSAQIDNCNPGDRGVIIDPVSKLNIQV